MLIFLIKESGGDEAAAKIIAEHKEDFECLHQKAETSTQTDRKTEADISTQTGADDDDDYTTTKTEGPVEEVITMETATTGEAEETADETAHQEPFDNQTAGMIIEERVIIGNNEYENIVFRAEQVEVTDNFEVNHIKNCDPEEESVNETEPEAAAESESTPNKDVIEGETVAEENNAEETVPLEISSSLPKVVADCIEVVFADVSEDTEVAAANTPEPDVEEAITEDNGGGARDIPADAELIETVEPESNAVAPEAEEINGVSSPDEEPVNTVMETILEVVCEKPEAAPENQHVPAEELPVPLVTEILVKVESALEEVTADDAVAVTDAPGISEEFITVEVPSNELTTIEELPEEALNSPEDEVNLESIPEVITTDESAEVTEDLIADVAPEAVAEENSVEETVPLESFFGLPKVVADCVEAVLAAVPPLDEEPVTTVIETECEEPNPVLANQGMSAEELSVPVKMESAHEEATADDAVAVKDMGPERVEEAEPSPVTVEDDAEVIPDAAIDALSLEFELRPISPPEPAMDNGIPAEEEVISATAFVLPSGEQEANLPIPEEPSKRAAEDEDEEAMEALSNECEAVPERVEEDATVQESSTGGQVTGDASSEEPVEESPNPCDEDETTEMLENTLESVVEAVLEKLEVIENIEKPADVPLMDTSEEPEPCLSVQEELIEEDVAPSVVAADEPTDSSPVVSEEAVEMARSLETQVSTVILEATEDEVPDERAHETGDCGDVLAVIDEQPEDSHIAASDEAPAECVEAVLETPAAEVITEDVATECDLVTCEEVAPDTESTQSAEMIVDTSVTTTDMEAFLVRLQSACTSTVEESAFRLEGLKMSSVGYSITVTIDVTPKEEQQ